MSTRLRLLAPVVVLTLVLAACAGASSPTPNASVPAASASIAASAAPETSAAPATSGPAAICTDAAAFRASMTALTNLKLAEVGVSGVTAALSDLQSSAQALLLSGKDLVAAPVGNLLAAVQALQATLAGLGDQPSLGAKLAAVKLAIEQIKGAAADVETAIGTTCPAQ